MSPDPIPYSGMLSSQCLQEYLFEIFCFSMYFILMVTSALLEVYSNYLTTQHYPIE